LPLPVSIFSLLAGDLLLFVPLALGFISVGSPYEERSAT
jgi:hypothetical protein